MKVFLYKMHIFYVNITLLEKAPLNIYSYFTQLSFVAASIFVV